MATKRIKVGDTVKWRGNSGTDEPKEAKILKIELCREGAKSGRDFKSIAETTKNRCIFDLDNGRWCRGHQIDL